MAVSTYAGVAEFTREFFEGAEAAWRRNKVPLSDASGRRHGFRYKTAAEARRDDARGAADRGRDPGGDLKPPVKRRRRP